MVVLPAVGSADASTACATRTRFWPVAAHVPAVNRTIRVIGVPRTSAGAIGAPPLTTAGKQIFGWDPFVRPGSGVGSVVLDAHTWPDGSALGNALLSRLHVGAIVILKGASGQVRCYRIVQRAQYLRWLAPLDRITRTWGPEQLAIIVCSGRRLGPQDWQSRTVWYGVPDASARP
ncbi:MAG: class F sortase [Marmoricola sp.]